MPIAAPIAEAAIGIASTVGRAAISAAPTIARGASGAVKGLMEGAQGAGKALASVGSKVGNMAKGLFKGPKAPDPVKSAVPLGKDPMAGSMDGATYGGGPEKLAVTAAKPEAGEVDKPQAPEAPKKSPIADFMGSWKGQAAMMGASFLPSLFMGGGKTGATAAAAAPTEMAATDTGVPAAALRGLGPAAYAAPMYAAPTQAIGESPLLGPQAMAENPLMSSTLMPRENPMLPPTGLTNIGPPGVY